MRRPKNYINLDLALVRGLSDPVIDALNILHSQLNALHKRPSMYASNGAEAVDQVKGYEYAMQALWGFPLDSRYHRYDFELKGCTCPKMDNYDLIGTSRRVYDQDCVFHGSGQFEELK